MFAGFSPWRALSPVICENEHHSTFICSPSEVCVYTLPLDCRVAGLAGVYALSIKNPDGQNPKKTRWVGEVGRVDAVGCGLHTVAGFFHCGICTVPN